MATLTINTLRNITGTDDTGSVVNGDFVSVARNFNNAKVPAIQLRDAVEAFVLAKIAEKQAIIDQKDTRIAELQADKDRLQTLIDAMGGTVEGLRLAKLARRQAAVDAQAAAEAEAISKAVEIAAIDAEA